jgi:mRNA interferase RelE/StbE
VSTTNNYSYNFQVARSAASALTGVLPEKNGHAVYEFITGPLREKPQRVGKPLGLPMAPAYSARRGDYRVLYFIDDATHTVTITTIKHRADAYRS